MVTRKDAASMALEQHVANVLAGHGWTVSQNVGYDDVFEGKRREMDVIGSRHWTRLNGREVVVRLQLVIETKLLSGAEILVGEEMKSHWEFGERCYFSWLGLDDDNVEKHVRRAIEAAGVSQEMLDRTMARFHELAYPPPENYAPANDLIADAPKAPRYGTVVRLATDKGDDVNSLASHGLRAALSCVQSLMHDSIERRAQRLRSDVATALKSGDPSLIDDVLESSMSVVELFHPLVVADVNLHTVWIDEITETPWCRIANLNYKTEEREWVDFVSLKAFDDWITNVTRYYEEFFNAPVPA